MRPVESFAFLQVGQPAEKKHGIRPFRRPEGLLRQRGMVAAGAAVAPRIGVADAAAIKGLLGGYDGSRVDQRRSRPLEPHPLEQLAHYQQPFLPGQGEDAVVLEQDGAVLGDGTGQPEGIFPVSIGKRRRVPAGIGEGEDALRRAVEFLRCKRAVLHRPEDRPPVVPHAARQLQITARAHPLGSVAGGSPVGQHKPAKPPLLPQNAGQQIGVLRGGDAVQPVVRAHHRIRPGLFDHPFKGAQIDFPQSPLVHHAVAGEAEILVGIGGKMLDAGADAPALYPLHKGRAEQAGHQRIL